MTDIRMRMNVTAEIVVIYLNYRGMSTLGCRKKR